MDRLTMLRSLIEKGTTDPFVRYGYAMELRRLGQESASADAFAELRRSHPDYLAAYLMAGGVLVKLGRVQEAIEVFDAGIAVARKQGNGNTEGELLAARAELE